MEKKRNEKIAFFVYFTVFLLSTRGKDNVRNAGSFDDFCQIM